MSDDLDLTGDDLAGIVDLFGALTRAELDEAIDELAFKRGADRPEGVVDAAIEDFSLVASDPPEGERLLVAGPTAFPTLPDGAEDLPHIMDVEPREVGREEVAKAVEERFRSETAEAVAAGDRDRMRTLLDASYDVEVWGPADLGGVRERLDDALDE